MNIETETGFLDDIELEMVDLSDRFEKSIVKYEYPFVDGADLEDLGQKAGTVKIRCFFFDNAAQSTYNDHIKLLNLLAKKDDFELLHPKYGIFKVKVESMDVRHDERKRTAEVDLCLVKRGFDRIEASMADAVDASAESAFLDGELEQLDEATYDFSLAGFDAKYALNPDLSILSQIKNAGGTLGKRTDFLRSYARQLDRQLNSLSATATAITQPVNSLTATITYTTNLPGRIIGIATKAVERVARLYDTAVHAPGRFLANMQFAFVKLISATQGLPAADRPGREARDLIVKHLTIACARRLALETAYVFAADEKERVVARKLEKTPTFDTRGSYLAPAVPAPIMNARELEESLELARTSLQEAVDSARGMQSLKVQAVQLLTHVSTIKLERDKIVTVTIDCPIPLHLVCLKYGLPYNYAERILSINPQIDNPCGVSGDIQIYTLGGAQ